MFFTVPRSVLPSASVSSVVFFFSAFSSSRSDLAGEDDVAALLVDLDDAHAELLPPQRVEIADRADVDLRSGQKRAHADVDRQPALDALDDASDDDLPLGVGLLDLVPDLHLLGLLARQHDVAFAILGALEQYVHDVAGLDGDLAVLVEEFADGDEAFGLVADIDDDVGLGDLEDSAFDDLAFRHVPEAVVINTKHGREFLRIHVFVVHRLHSRACGLASPGASRCAGLLAHFLGRRPTRFLHSPFRARPPCFGVAPTGVEALTLPVFVLDIAQDYPE